MMENISRRSFMKGVGAMALATAASGLLGGCSDGSMYVDATGLNEVAEMKGVRMTVRKMSYTQYEGGSYYFVPEVLISNSGATGVPVKPTGGSFEVWLNGSSRLEITTESMARLDNGKEFIKMETRTLSRGQQEKGCLCAKGSSAASLNYVYVIFYPNPDDKLTALRCKIYAKDIKPMLGL